jgi:hypothetical protein
LVPVVAVFGLSSSCATLNQLAAGATAAGVTPPSLVFQGATLVQSPSQAQLAAYYCPDVVPAPFGVPGGAALLCQGFFGPRPSPADMTVAFDLAFKVRNPNGMPLPLGDVLTAVTVFPAGASQRLGAACLHLCAPGQVGCTGQPDPSACQASSRDVRSMSDFGNAAANLLIAGGIAAAAGQTPTLVAPQVAAGGDLDVTVRFSFGPEQLLATLRQLAQQSVNELKAGRTPTFTIPYRLEGTVWFDAGSLGRVAVGFGPTEGTWVLPTQGLLPR